MSFLAFIAGNDTFSIIDGMNFLPYLLSLVSLLHSFQCADIIFAGDAMQHQRQLDFARRPDGKYDYSDYFRDIKPYIDSADYAIVNLETPIAGGRLSGYPCFNAPDEYLDALTDAGFNMTLLANNHMLDRGDSGLVTTLRKLRERNIDHTGIFFNSDDKDTISPFIKDINGIKVAFLNYTYGTNGFTVKGDPIINYIDRKRIADDINKSKEKGAEIIAVCPHWGDEYVMLPPKRVKEMADYVASLGVDMIIGGHPHVIQPMELRENALDSTKRTLIVYSLGNFISGMRTTDTRGGAMVKVRLERDSTGKAIVKNASYRLIYTVPPEIDHRRPNFHLVYPSDTIPDNRCKLFEMSAESVLSKHNRDVYRQ